LQPSRKTRPPTVAAIVREQTGAAWSRARDLCTEGRVTVNGERCLDPALRVSPGAVVVVDERAPKLRTGALPESAIAFFDRDVVVVDKPAGMLSIPYERGDKDTLADCTRTLLRRMGVAAWLCLPIRAPGQHIGYLGFEASQGSWSWQDSDITGPPGIMSVSDHPAAAPPANPVK